MVSLLFVDGQAGRQAGVHSGMQNAYIHVSHCSSRAAPLRGRCWCHNCAQLMISALRPGHRPPACPPVACLPACSTHEFKYSSYHGTEGVNRQAAAAEAAKSEAAQKERTEAAGQAAAAAAQAAAAGGEEGPHATVGQRLKANIVDKVMDAAAQEAPGSAPMAQQLARQRGKLRLKERRRPPGVLFLNEAEPQVRSGCGAVWLWARQAGCLASSRA